MITPLEEGLSPVGNTRRGYRKASAARAHLRPLGRCPSAAVGRYRHWLFDSHFWPFNRQPPTDFAVTQ